MTAQLNAEIASDEPSRVYDLIAAGDFEKFSDIFYSDAARGGGTVKVAAPGVSFDAVSRDDLELAEVDPADADEAVRWCILFDDIPECDEDTAVLLYLDASGEMMMRAIDGPAHDHAVAVRIIARDINATPRAHEPVIAPTFAPLPRIAANDNDSDLDGLSTKWAERKRQERHQMRQAVARSAKATLPGRRGEKDDKDDKSVFVPPALVLPSAWQGKPVPPRSWFIADLIPNRTVTLLSGDGGLGKSLLALQIGVAAVLGESTMGLKPAKGRVLYVGAEDDEDEFKRRMADIIKEHDAQFVHLGDDFYLLPLADRDAVLGAPDRNGTMMMTQLLVWLIERITEIQPQFIILDTSADLFGGDEIKRSQVRQFVAMLRSIAISLDCAVLLLSHPSVAGMQSGTGTSGSTAWNNSVRSRLYLTAGAGDDVDPDCRVLTVMKANYGKKGDAIRMRYDDGIFITDDGRSSPDITLLNHRAETVFKDLLSKFNRTLQNLSATSGTTYAPAKMVKHPDCGGVSKRQLADAMQRLLERDEVRILVEGSESRLRKRLILASEDYRSK